MFANTKLFYLFLAVPLIILIFTIDILQQRKRAKIISGSNIAEILPFYTESQKWIRIIFYVLGICLSIIAIARPRWGFETIESNVKGRDVMLVLDTSYSMATGDVAPTRLDSAKRSIVEMLNMQTGDRVGLMVFSGKSELLAPVTHDYAAVEFFLESVYPGMLSKTGTNIGEAISTAIDSFDDTEPRNKMIILMTDGEDLDGPYYQMLKKAKESGIKIFTVGIGSGNGEPIPLRNAKGEIESYVKDENGKHVISRLNESRLIEIAENSGGSYLKSTNSKGELRRFIESINSIETKEQSDLKYEQMKEHYDIFLIPALLCFAIGFILDQGRVVRKKSNRFGWLAGTKRLWFVVVLLLSFGMFCPVKTFSQTPDESADLQNSIPEKKLMENINGGFWGNKAFEKGDYEKAIVDYTRAENKLKGNELAKLYYNKANAYFMSGEYDKASEFYENASWFAKDSDLRAKISFNRGLNAFKQKKFDEAMMMFKDSLFENDSNDDARYNYQICRKLTESMQQQQQNQNQNQQQNHQSEQQQQQAGESQQSDEYENDDNQESQKGEQKQMSKEEMQQMLDALDEKEKDNQKEKSKGKSNNNKGKYW